jgi:hypothetical protein
MALSLLKNLVPKAASRTSRNPLTKRTYSSHGGHHGAAVKLNLEKRVVQTRVVFPSPLGSSILPSAHGSVANASVIDETQVLSPQEAHGTDMKWRSTSFTKSSLHNAL